MPQCSQCFPCPSTVGLLGGVTDKRLHWSHKGIVQAVGQEPSTQAHNPPNVVNGETTSMCEHTLQCTLDFQETWFNLDGAMTMLRLQSSVLCWIRLKSFLFSAIYCCLGRCGRTTPQVGLHLDSPTYTCSYLT